MSDPPPVDPVSTLRAGVPRRRRPWLRSTFWAAAVLLSGGAGGFVARELSQARLQARFFSWVAADSRFEPAPGPSPSVRFPSFGPQDERLGYARLPWFLARLAADGAEVEAQARWTPRLQQLQQYGIFPAYHEKTSAGLRVLDRTGAPLYASIWPGHTWPDFEALPTALVRSLLFIENRDLLEPGSPLRNPAVEWPRLFFAVGQAAMKFVEPDRKVPGASTLATQLEKYRHSDGGATKSAREKLLQMFSASVRAYLDGPDTSNARRRIVLDYVNTLPLGAAPGHGEVHGVGDGLWAWFALPRDEADELLKDAPTIKRTDPRLEERGQAYKRMVAMLVGQRRPFWYFIENREALRAHVDAYLRLMPAEIVSPALREAALRAPLAFADEERRKPEAMVADRKGADAVRVHLLEPLGVPDLYTLDRLDLTVHSTLDTEAQVSASSALRALNDPEVAKAAGLVGPFLLSQGDPAQVRYSFTLFERVEGANLLRVHTDTGEGPFSLNDGMKLELGSTAKLRTLVTYLEVVAEIHEALQDLPKDALKRLKVDPRDDLTRFVVGRLTARPGEPLRDLLEAAMDRRYSASPKEKFVTGGGVHTFNNFSSKDDDEAPTVRDAFARSVNLPFVRMMRDIVDHTVAQQPRLDALFDDVKDPRRRVYLERFADIEGRVYQERFYLHYRDLEPDAALERLAGRVRPTPERLTVVFRTVRPEASVGELSAFLRGRARVTGKPLTDAKIADLYARHAPGRFDLQDRGYLAGIHPLELWTVAFLRAHAGAGWTQVADASRAERVAVYRWLMGPARKVQQDRRIRMLVEVDAFGAIHQRWQRLGYPFQRLVPSLATALGSSGDRPTALAELVGILLSDGVRQPTKRVERLHFAENTPYETLVRPFPGRPERVLPHEVAAVAREAMRGVVEDGTASRIKGSFLHWGLMAGGKTGTGDNRRERFDKQGRLVGEEVRNRTGTFVFYLGDRWFGVLTAHVPGPAAAEYRFTSALPSQALKYLAPHLAPVFSDKPPPKIRTLARRGVRQRS